MPCSATLHVRRLVIEALSPVMVASGGDDPLLDNLLARDANGLPMIPATTLAGALRARLGEAEARELLGYQEGDAGARSRLSFTDALVHCGDGKPRDGWALLPVDDDVAAWLSQESPIRREHVRLNGNGVVDGDGKFDRSAVPAGTRFTFEINAWGDAAPLERVAEILRAGLTLGGATRSGYGAFACIAVGAQSFDLMGHEALKPFLAYAAADLGDAGGFEMSPLAVSPPEVGCWRLSGRIEGPLLVGAARDDGRGGRQPYSEPRIEWDGAKGRIAAPRPVLPGSAIKGPLRHRTFYHLNRLGVEDAQAETEALFGAAAAGDEGGAGKLRFLDATINGGEEITVSHVALDRFTGGARDQSGALFSDRMLWQPQVEITINCLAEIGGTARAALDAALSDLAQGLLGLGAEWGEGAGIFADCTIVAPDGKEARG